MTALRPGSGWPCPGPVGVVMVPSFLGAFCPHQFDETPHRTVRLARRLTFRGATSSDKGGQVADGERQVHAAVTCPLRQGETDELRYTYWDARWPPATPRADTASDQQERRQPV